MGARRRRRVSIAAVPGVVISCAIVSVVGTVASVTVGRVGGRLGVVIAAARCSGEREDAEGDGKQGTGSHGRWFGAAASSDV